MKVIGFCPTSFQTKEGNTISGLTLWLASAIEPGKGYGVRVDRQFVSSHLLLAADLDIEVNDEVKLNYNKFGRLQEITKLEGAKNGN